MATDARCQIEVIQGCMFSGKTEELIQRLRAAEGFGQTVIAFKHSRDDRYDPEHLITHTQQRYPALRVPSAAAIEERCGDARVIGIDEGHFFGPRLIEVAVRLSKAGQRVIIVGLENDAWGKPFSPMPELARIAVHVVTRRVPCVVCGSAAPFTQRMVPVTDTFMVGGAGDYEPRCHAHFEPLPGAPPPVGE